MSLSPAAFQAFILWLARSAFVIGLGMVIVLSLTPASDPSPGDISDKIEHFLAYLALAAAGAAAFHGHRDRLILIVSLIVFGILMEFGQMFSPGRDPSLGDAIANTLGILCGVTMGSLGVLAMDALRPLLKAS